MTLRSFLFFFTSLLFFLSACRPDPCVNLNCQNGGTCVDGECQCPEGFIGPECVTELDPCLIKQCVEAQSNDCMVNDQNQAVCICKDGYEGDLCENLWTDKFTGQFTCIEECDGESLTFPVRIEEGPEFKRITIVNFHNQFNEDLQLEAKLVATLITPTVVEMKNQFMFFGLVEGSGLWQNEDLIGLNYTITTDIDTVVCSAAFERK